MCNYILNNNDHKKLSESYWSQRASEFSDLRIKEYYSKIGKEFKKYIIFEVEKMCTNKGCKANDIKVLDVGTGAGLFSILFREIGCNVYAIDFSKNMLKNARDNLSKFNFNDVDLIQSDTNNMPFDENFFDIVWCRNVTWILTCVERTYLEIYRVLKKGGIFINLDANYGKAFRQSVEKGIKSEHSTQTQAQLNTRNHLAMDLAISYCDRPKWDRAILKEIGFNNVSCIENFYKKFNLEKEQNKLVGTNKNENVPLFLIKSIK